MSDDERIVTLRGPGVWIIRGWGSWTIEHNRDEPLPDVAFCDPSVTEPPPPPSEPALEPPPKPPRIKRAGRPSRMVRVTGAKGVFDPAFEIESRSVAGRILEDIYDNGPKLRTDLAKDIRASSSTVSVQARKLILEGWLKENEDFTLSLAKELDCLPPKVPMMDGTLLVTHMVPR